MPKKRADTPAADNPQFRERLQYCVNKVGGQVRMEELSGVPRGTLAGHLLVTEPQRPSLIAMARAAQVNVAWLVAHIGPREIGAANDPSEDPSTGWVTVNLFDRCFVEDGKLVVKTSRPIVKVSPEMGARAFPEVKDPKKLLAFCAVDSFMDPDILENEYVICAYSDLVIPSQMSGILGVVESNQISARYVAKVTPSELLITHRKTETVDPLRMPINELGKSVFVLGRVLLAGSYVGNRHRDWIPRLLTSPNELKYVVILRINPNMAQEVETGLRALGLAATTDLNEPSVFTVLADQDAIDRLPMMPGFLKMERYIAPIDTRKSA